MSATTPVERVAELLESAGFRRLEMPLNIANLNIPFSCAFVGREPSPDLIVVADAANEQDEIIQQRVEGVARALDVMKSSRPLTVVVVGPRPDLATMTSLSRVARTLPVGSAADEKSLRNWLAVLLPLDIPEPQDGSLALLALDTANNVKDPISTALTSAAYDGEDAVRRRFHALLEEPFVHLEEEI